MATKRPRRKVSQTHQRVSDSVVVSIARLEQQAEQTSERFDVLGDKFDRILSRVEELALHTTSLNSRHDTEIQVLQKQIASSETILNQTREDINAMSTRLTALVGKELSDAINEMSAAIDQLSDKMERQNKNLEDRVDKLERWRMLLIGGGLVIGFIMSRLADNVFNVLLANHPQ
jgi:methyl-accepting chemotaxis protein